jgi:glyoxylase I family protein
MQTTFHHIAITVRDITISQPFYEKLGFSEVHRWDADDNSIVIVHLKMDTVVLELFEYAENRNAPPLQLEVANNLSALGVKHFGIKVADVNTAFEQMKKAGYELGNPEVKNGRTKVDYFFIKDPDGMWVEIVQDDRGY